MDETVDGEYQKYSVEGGAYIRKHFFGKYPELLALVADLTDDQLPNLRRGGHDPEKVYAAYKAAIEHQGRADGHPRQDRQGLRPRRGRRRPQRHPPAEEAEREGTARVPRPLRHSDRGRTSCATAPFYRPAEDSPEIEYLRERRAALGGCVPARKVRTRAARRRRRRRPSPSSSTGGERDVSTTMALRAHAAARCCKDPEIGKRIVPIVPDEARTFGMESLFRQIGIYASKGQLYEPVDSKTLLYYQEAKDGQILEEGITEAGSMASFTAAGTAYATHGVDMIPFFIYYSMFGFQRIGDLIWAFGDQRGQRLPARRDRRPHDAERRRAAAPGRPQPSCSPRPSRTSSPTTPPSPTRSRSSSRTASAACTRSGEDIFYYLTLYNENYAMPPMPEGAADGILRGSTASRRAAAGGAPARRSCSAAARS